MPPRKKLRLSSYGASTPSVTDQAETPRAGEAEVEPDVSKHDPVSDPWTDEQEIALLKGITRWKPVGMHKHFRMISLSQHLRSHGHRAEHTRIPGIWSKLGRLYNLKTLDEREDSFGDYGAEDGEHADTFYSFELPTGEFSGMKFDRRIDNATSSSPPALEHQLSNGSEDASRRWQSTIEDAEEPRSSPGSARGSRYLRGNRGGGRTKRGSRLQESTSSGRVKPPSEPDVQEDDQDQDDEDDDDEEDSERNTPTTRARGGRGARGRARGRRGPRRRGG